MYDRTIQYLETILSNAPPKGQSKFADDFNSQLKIHIDQLKNTRKEGEMTASHCQDCTTVFVRDDDAVSYYTVKLCLKHAAQEERIAELESQLLNVQQQLKQALNDLLWEQMSKIPILADLKWKEQKIQELEKIR